MYFYIFGQTKYLQSHQEVKIRKTLKIRRALKSRRILKSRKLRKTPIVTTRNKIYVAKWGV